MKSTLQSDKHLANSIALAEVAASCDCFLVYNVTGMLVTAVCMLGDMLWDDCHFSPNILWLVWFLQKCLKQCVNAGDGSNSCWAEMEQFVIGTYPMYPLTIDMQQRLILHYLQPMGEYQEVICILIWLCPSDTRVDQSKTAQARIAGWVKMRLAALSGPSSKTFL